MPVTDSKELAFAKDALFTRHPAMKDWPSTHGEFPLDNFLIILIINYFLIIFCFILDWTFYNLVPTHVHLLDYYGGATHVPLDEYFKAKP